MATTTMISFLLSLLLVVGADNSTCEWRFYSCRNIGEVWQMTCEVELMKFDDRRRVCGESRKKAYTSRHSQKYRDFCRIIPKCSITPVWCSWGPWESTFSDCELRRTRRECCHPVTLKIDSRISCGSYRKAEQKTVPGCKGEKEEEDDVLDTRRFKIFIRDCILITISCIFVLVTCTVGCRLYCRYSAGEARSSTPRDQTQQPQTQQQLQRPLMPSAVYQHGGDSRAAISSPKLQPDSISLPPSYEEAVKISA